MFKEDTFNNKTILITGGGSGLGLEMAKNFVTLGANMAICGRTESKLKKAAGEISSKGEGMIKYYVADVRDYRRVQEMIDQIVDDFGTLDGLINNAAGNFLVASEDLTPGGFKSVVDIVLHGSFNCTHVFGNYLIENER